jgi:hypothetical protein
MGFGHLLHVAGGNRAAQARARIGHGGEDGFFVFGDAPHRGDEVGDQIRPPLQLHGDLTLVGVYLLVVCLDPVVATSRQR